MVGIGDCRQSRVRLGLCIQLSGVSDDGRLDCRISGGDTGRFAGSFCVKCVVVDGHF